MGADAEPRVIAVVGPTASGKSDLGQQIALDLGGEVLSADSMQIYRYMNIGTGKMLPEDQLVPHHGLDLVDPGEAYSAALYQPYARGVIESLTQQGKPTVLVGGTGLYLRAALDDYEFPAGDQVNNPVREHYQRFADTHGEMALWELLHEKDPASAAVIHPHNVRRVIRAFELMAEGESYAQQKERLATIPPKIPALWLGIRMDPSVLNRRIDRRVDTMMEQGLVEEVKGLLREGFREGITAPQAIGYKEIVAALDGEQTLEEAVAQIKTATHRYAKRQRTWFRKDQRIHWLEADDAGSSLLTQALAVIRENSST